MMVAVCSGIKHKDTETSAPQLDNDIGGRQGLSAPAEACCAVRRVQPESGHETARVTHAMCNTRKYLCIVRLSSSVRRGNRWVEGHKHMDDLL
jgi:hypothetical protein